MPPLAKSQPRPRADQPERAERLAVNLFDLDRIDPFIREQLGLARKLVAEAIRIDADRSDETAVAFGCPLEEAAATLDIIRDHDRRAGDHPTRAYLRRRAGGAWERMPANAVFSVIMRGQLALNADVFPSFVPAERVAAPQARRLV